jgi:predicted AAA+ superfamily ATPase
MIKREKYLNAIRPFIDKPLIKAITGIRRCGKSTLMLQIIDELIENGIDTERIIYINKELFEFDAIRNYSDLHNYVVEHTKHPEITTYLFIDEVQEIGEWEKAVNSLLAIKNFDIYITGSNARLLSSELATLLSGRYLEFKMYTLTYPEFKFLTELNQKEHTGIDTFDLFLKYGGFPGIHAFEWNETVIRQYLSSLYSTILLKDVVVRYNIRDAAMLEKIIEFLIDNCGNITTAKNISDYVKSQQRKVSVETVQSYISFAMNALLLQQVRRFDLQGKRLLETHEKYYLSDVGFRLATTGFTPESLPGQLENVVLLHLLADGYKVTIGKMNNLEIDFIAQKNQDKIYIQVCTTLNDSKVIDREYGSLEKVNDHFPKFVLSLDQGFETSRNGIRWMNLKDFLSS